MPVYKDKERNSWFFKCSINGKQYLKRGYPTKKDALNAEALFMLESNSDKKVKVIKFYDLCDLFLSYKKKTLKESTYYNRKLMIEKHIKPLFKNVNVLDLKMIDFNNFRKYLLKLKDTSLPELLLMILKQMFEYLDLYYDINIKYAKLIVPIKKDQIVFPQEDLSSKRINIDLVKKYYSLSNDYYRLYISFSLLYGLRISEVRGLAVNSFNFETNKFYIYQQLTSKTGSGKSIRCLPKTESSKRNLLLFESLKNDLLLHISKYKLKKKGYIFFSSRDKKDGIGETTIRTYLDNISKENNLKHIAPHQFRHLIASYLLDHGIPSEVVGKFLGHKQNITLDIYIDLEESYLKKIYQTLENLYHELSTIRT